MTKRELINRLEQCSGSDDLPVKLLSEFGWEDVTDIVLETTRTKPRWSGGFPHAGPHPIMAPFINLEW
jgi:hypothetical protein